MLLWTNSNYKIGAELGNLLNKILLKIILKIFLSNKVIIINQRFKDFFMIYNNLQKIKKIVYLLTFFF